jgi:hypothetical protein
MPRYRYHCDNCLLETIIFHGINEVISDCVLCESSDSMRKMLSTPIVLNNKEKDTTNKEVGQITNEYIEANREILENQKKEATQEDYEPS